MKGEILAAMAVAVTMLAFVRRAGAFECGAMQKKKLGQGAVQIYRFDTLTLHAYQTEDPLHSECFLLEAPGNLVAIEAPAFESDIASWQEYIAALGKPLSDVLISYHAAGGRWYGGAKSHATANALRAIYGGATEAQACSLGETLAPDFNPQISGIDSVLSVGTNIIGGIEFEIADAGDGYDIGIPAIGAVYTHMLGASTLCTLAGQNQIEKVLASVLESLERIKARGYPLVLSGHDTPKTLAEVDVKMAYARELWNLLMQDGDKEDFMARIKKMYPHVELN